MAKPDDEVPITTEQRTPSPFYEAACHITILLNHDQRCFHSVKINRVRPFQPYSGPHPTSKPDPHHQSSIFFFFFFFFYQREFPRTPTSNLTNL